MANQSAESRARLASRSIGHVVVLGANGTMGYGSGALFTQAVPKVTFLARSKEKAQEGLDAAIGQVRSGSVASRVAVGDYDHDLDSALASADLVFEALAEDVSIKKAMFDRVEAARRPDSIVATVTSGLSINSLAAGRGESFRQNFLGLHFFNPPNVIVGTEIIAGSETAASVVDFVEAFAQLRLGRETVRTADTPAFAGNRVGFKVLNEAVQLALEHGPAMVDRIIGPYTGRAMTPLATIDLVGWDVHAAIVDNIYANTADEAHATLRMPDEMRRLLDSGVLGNKSGRGFFMTEGTQRLALDLATGEYRPATEAHRDDLGYIADVNRMYAQGRYREGIAAFLAATGDAATLAKRVVAGYLSYSFHRAGEVCPSIDEIDRIMGAGFNWAPPSVLVDAMGAGCAVELIAACGLAVPPLLTERAASRRTARTFSHPTMNPGRFFVAA